MIGYLLDSVAWSAFWFLAGVATTLVVQRIANHWRNS